MKKEIFTLDMSDLSVFLNVIPGTVIRRASTPGYFSIGAIGMEKDNEKLLGIAQYYADIQHNGNCFADVIYVYVLKEYRRKGIGFKLVKKINRILKESLVKQCVVRLADEERTDDMLPLSEIEAFFKACGYINLNYDIIGETRHVDTTLYSRNYIKLTYR